VKKGNDAVRKWFPFCTGYGSRHFLLLASCTQQR
jgi:hypothetical protein